MYTSTIYDKFIHFQLFCLIIFNLYLLLCLHVIHLPHQIFFHCNSFWINNNMKIQQFQFVSIILVHVHTHARGQEMKMGKNDTHHSSHAHVLKQFFCCSFIFSFRFPLSFSFRSIFYLLH